MKFRAIRGFGVSKDAQGTTTEYIPTGQVINVTEDWQIDMLERLVDAGLAEHDKMIDDPLEKKETAGNPAGPAQGTKSRRKQPKAKRQTKGK